jgi:hypothetical protein
MAERTLLDMDRLEARVRAAARLVPRKEMQWRRLVTRSREEFDHKAHWMVPLHHPTHDCHAVELVPCDADDEGAVTLHKEELPEQIRLDARVLYELWMEQLPEEVLGEVMG